MALLALKPDRLRELWPQIGPLLQSALDHGMGELTADDILARAMRGRMFVYVATDGEKVLGAIACEFIAYPKCTSLNVVAGAGRGLERASVDAVETLRELARAGGASYIETRSRPSVARMHRRYFKGAKAQYVVSVMEV